MVSKDSPNLILLFVVSLKLLENISLCAGELHLEICLQDLREFMKDIELVVSDPVVPFQETVTDTSNVVCLAKSPNKHHRLYVRALPLGKPLTDAIEKGDISPKDEVKTRIRSLVEKYEWDSNEARRIWAFGPENVGPNLLVDVTRGLQYMSEIKDSVVSAFGWVSGEGLLAGEPLRGVRMNIIDALLHTDRVQRGGGQIIPTARRAFLAAEYTAKPALMEPVYLVEIQCPLSAINGVHKVLNKRRGIAFDEETKPTGQKIIKAYLPVAESFGFTSVLREETGGKAFPQCVFDHWEQIPGDPLDNTTKVSQITTTIRKRKGLSPQVPPLSDYLDKL